MAAELLEPNGEGQSGGRKPGDWTAPPDDPTEIARLESLGEEVFERLEEIANICALVAQFFAGDTAKTALWFRTRNALLGDIAPLLPALQDVR